ARRPRRVSKKKALFDVRRSGRRAGKKFQLAGLLTRSGAGRAQCECQFNCAAGSDDAPALSVNLDSGQALGGVNQYALDLLRREQGVCFEHAGDRGGDERRGERRAVNELVVLAYHVGLLELDVDELAQEVEGKRSRFVEVAVNVAVLFDEGAQFFVRRAIQFRVKLRLGGCGRVRQDGRGNPDAGREHVGLL